MSRPKEIWLSASQLKTFSVFPGPAQADTCGRKYYFEYGLTLPRPPISSAILGDVIHAVIERFLKADELGLDPFTKEPVDLYPAGWDKDITQDDCERVKRLIKQAEEDGLLRRLPKRMVECDTKDFLGNFNNFRVMMTGRLDLVEPETPEEIPTITDWKSCSSFNYCLSSRKGTKRYMGHDIQMLWYGLWYKMTFGVKGPIRLRQIYFPTRFEKDVEEITFKDVSIILDDDVFDEFGAWLNQQVGIAVQLRVDGSKAKPTTGACDMYRGCHFRDICNGCISVDQYSTIHTKNEKEEGTDMPGILGRFRDKGEEKNETTKPEANTVKEEAPKTESKSRGIGRKKTDDNSERSGESVPPVQSSSEKAEPKKRGIGRSKKTEVKEEKVEDGKSEKSTGHTNAGDTEKPKPDEKGTTDTKTSEGTGTSEPAADKPEAKEPVNKGGQKPLLDLIVLVRAVPRINIPGKRQYTSLSRIAERTFDFVVSRQKAEKKVGNGITWLDLDPFQRRDLLKKYVDDILGAVNGSTVYTDGSEGCDQKALLNILLSYAPVVIYGV